MRRVGFEANALCVAAIVLIVLKTFLLNRIAEPASGLFEFGVIFEGVLASIIASYVFFFIVVHVRDQRNRSITQPYLMKHAKHIVGQCKAQILEINRIANSQIDVKNATMDQVRNAFATIAPYFQAPLIVSHFPLSYANWFQFFQYYNNRTREDIRKILGQIIYADVALIGIISDIEDCHYFYMIDQSIGIRTSNPDLSVWSNSFFKYYQHCQHLDLYLIDVFGHGVFGET